MAKHKKRGRRRFRRYIRGNADEQLNLGTLAGRTLTVGAFDETVSERTYISSLKAIWSLKDWTGIDEVGPLLVGIAHGDYSGPEIESFIEQTASWAESDLIGQEVGKRKIKIVGTFMTRSNATDSYVLNDGRPITTKLGWILTQQQTIAVWAYNLGSAAIATTVPDVFVQGHANLWPQ